MTSHLLFDLDGTITDSRDGIVRCIVHALETLKRPIPVDRALEGFIGAPLARTFETLLATTDQVLVGSAIKAYRDRFEGAKANGVRSIGVTWGYGSREELEDAGADDIVSSVREFSCCWVRSNQRLERAG